MSRRLAFVLVLTAVVASAYACAPGGTGPQASPSPVDSSGTPPTTLPSPSVTGSPTTSPAAGSSQLTIVVDDGTGATTTWTLTCDPPGGSHPDPATACTTLAEHATALRPVPKDRVCAQVYSGPERATITGTWGGEQVLATLSRTDACQTARWNELVGLLPPSGR